MEDNIIQLLIWRYLLKNLPFQYPGKTIEEKCNIGNNNDCNLPYPYSTRIKNYLTIPYLFKNDFKINIYRNINSKYNPFDIMYIRKTILDFSNLQQNNFDATKIIINDSNNFMANIRSVDEVELKYYINSRINASEATIQILPIIKPEIYTTWNIFKLLYNERWNYLSSIGSSNYLKTLEDYKKNYIDSNKIISKIISIIFDYYFLEEDLTFDNFLREIIRNIRIEPKNDDPDYFSLIKQSIINQFKNQLIDKKLRSINNIEFSDFSNWLEEFIKKMNILLKKMNNSPYLKHNRIKYFNMFVNFINSDQDIDSFIDTLRDVMIIYIEGKIKDENNEAYIASTNSIIVNNIDFINTNPFFAQFYLSFLSFFDNIILEEDIFVTPQISLNYDFNQFLKDQNNEPLLTLKRTINNISYLSSKDKVNFYPLIKYPCQVILSEKVDGQLVDILSKISEFSTKNLRELQSLYFQLIYCFYKFRNTFPDSTIGDSWTFNILYKKTNLKSLYFNIPSSQQQKNIYYRLPLFGYIIKIVNMKSSFISVPPYKNPPENIATKRRNEKVKLDYDTRKSLTDLNNIISDWSTKINFNMLNKEDIEIYKNLNTIKLISQQCPKYENNMDSLTYIYDQKIGIREFTQGNCDDGNLDCLYEYYSYPNVINRTCNNNPDCYEQKLKNLYKLDDEICLLGLTFDSDVFLKFNNYIITSQEYINNLNRSNDDQTLKIYS